MKILVGIASYGERNLPYLRQIIERYERMRFSIDIVVFSEAAKDLGESVRVMVGLPTDNPWSLPFAHRPYFAERADSYDLFIYSEDDMDVTEANLDAFLELQSVLRDDEIVGFIRYENGENGVVSLPDFRDHFHWKIDSVNRRGDWAVAEFTNAHSAFYVMTQAQLKRAIQSGGFAQEPHEGEYDMLCSAATDPYTSCGLRRVIGISRFNEFLILHAPNRYAGKIGLPLDMANRQISALLAIAAGTRPAFQLLPAFDEVANKTFYEVLPAEVVALACAGDATRSVLSIGCGAGDTEAKLSVHGLAVTALPLDSIIGAVAEAHGIEVLLVSLADAISTLGNRRFDAILISNIPQLLNDPSGVTKQWASYLSPGGSLIIVSSNADYLPRRWWRGWHSQDAKRPEAFRPSVGALVTAARDCGLSLDALVWHGYRDHTALSGALPPSRGVIGLARRTWQWARDRSRSFDEGSQQMFERRRRAVVAMRFSTGRWLATDWAVRLVRSQ